MQYIFLSEDVVQVTCTFAELCTMESLDQKMYATPTPHGCATQIYIAERPHFRDDFVLATVEDFCEEEGWTSLGWEEMTEEEQDAVADDETTITRPRSRPLESSH